MHVRGVWLAPWGGGGEAGEERLEARVDCGFEVDEGAVDVEGEDFVAGEGAGWVGGGGHGQGSGHFGRGNCGEWYLGASEKKVESIGRLSNTQVLEDMR